MGITASAYPPEREPKIIPRTSMHPTSNRRQTIPRLSSTGRRTWLHSWQLSTSIPARLGSLQSNIQAPFHQAHHGTFCNLRKSSSWDPEHCESSLRGGIDLSRKRLRGEEMGKNPDPRGGLYSQKVGRRQSKHSEVRQHLSRPSTVSIVRKASPCSIASPRTLVHLLNFVWQQLSPHVRKTNAARPSPVFPNIGRTPHHHSSTSQPRHHNNHTVNLKHSAMSQNNLARRVH